MPGLALHCVVCKGSFGDKPNWNRHLIQGKHQLLARKELPNWEKKDWDRVLVVYGRFPVGRDDSLVQFLSKEEGTMVTDFVWFDGPRRWMGYVQFGSRNKMMTVMKAIPDSHLDRQGPTFLIQPDQLYQVTEGQHYRHFESFWNEFRPKHGNPSALPSRITLPSPYHTRGSLVAAAGAAAEAAGLGLRRHLATILKLMDVPFQDVDYQTVIRINWGLPFKSSICQNWIMKLRQQPSTLAPPERSSLCILIQEGRLGNEIHFLDNEFDRIEEQLFKKHGEKTFFLSPSKEWEVLGPATSPSTSSSAKSALHFSIKGMHTDTIWNIRIVSNPKSYVELRTWQLAQHLCSFDPHCHPVLALLYYWASVNSMISGEPEVAPNPTSTASAGHDFDHSTLNWLVIMFFRRERLIPSAKSLLTEPRHYYPVPRKLSLELATAFDDRLKTSMDWRRNHNTLETNVLTAPFAERVFTLLCKFFSFCAALLEDDKNGHGWILNTRDGERIPKKGLLSSIYGGVGTKLVGCEIKYLKQLLGAGKGGNRIVMLDPFLVDGGEWMIATGNLEHALVAMGETGRRLKGHLDGNIRLDIGEFLNLLKIQKEPSQEVNSQGPRGIGTGNNIPQLNPVVVLQRLPPDWAENGLSPKKAKLGEKNDINENVESCSPST